MRINLNTHCTEVLADKFCDFYETESNELPTTSIKTLKEYLEEFLKDYQDENKLQDGEEEKIKEILANGYTETSHKNYFNVEAVEVYTVNPATWEYHLIIPIDEAQKHNENL